MTASRHADRNEKQAGKPERRWARLTEAAAERVTCFVSGHWGTLIAFCILLTWLGVTLISGIESVASDLIERAFTMSSLVLIFILQRSVTKDTTAMQLKLNELLNALETADSTVTHSDDLDEEELEQANRQSKQSASEAD